MWRDRLRPASFRGVVFEVEGREGQGGRRIALHEYPGRDLPYAEDLGRSARLATFEAFVVGDDYFDRRDRLIAALETAGPGTLVDPWLGERRVAVQSFSWRETLGDGRMVRFSVQFVEAGAKRHPAAEIDTEAVVEKSANTMLAASRAAFVSAYSVGGQPQFVADDAAAIATGFATAIEGLVGTLPAPTQGALAAADAAKRLVLDVAIVAREGTSLAARIVHAVRSLTDAVEGAAILYGGMAALTTFGSDLEPPPGATAARRRQAVNRTALVSLVRRAALSGRVRAARKIAFQSYDDAVAVRDELAAALDAEIAIAGAPVAGVGADDNAFAALVDLRAAMIRDIDTRSANLTRIVKITNPDSRPALAVSYAIYGDASRDAEIAARNRIAHPGFVAAGRLDVLSA